MRLWDSEGMLEAQELLSAPSKAPEGPVFDYTKIPDGYYQKVIETGNPVRRAWHMQKFERVIDSLEASGKQGAILDIGCFAGTFLSRVPETLFSRQVGVDILPNQIRYAQEHFGTGYREFRHVPDVSKLGHLVQETFDCVTLIEVIEHLERQEIAELFKQISRRLNPGGHLIFSTPNYLSTWPLLEILVNKMSDVSYEEQHITRFTFFGAFRLLEKIYPTLWDEFELEFKTTTHFLSPFLAALSLPWAMRLSRRIPHRRWGNPFGNLILISLKKKAPAIPAST